MELYVIRCYSHANASIFLFFFGFFSIDFLIQVFHWLLSDEVWASCVIHTHPPKEN
ncbi:uncharacterized protein G2W53_023509 [Senna tora]|uniref:Uncharacterized protein n=1 Tax=Senna tora TaxID=362788 RepID=A0A834TIG5_9FABA|nr:uncharacterized protein G2W53_023509 [Senna tora]